MDHFYCCLVWRLLQWPPRILLDGIQNALRVRSSRTDPNKPSCCSSSKWFESNYRISSSTVKIHNPPLPNKIKMVWTFSRLKTYIFSFYNIMEPWQCIWSPLTRVWAVKLYLDNYPEKLPKNYKGASITKTSYSPWFIAISFQFTRNFMRITQKKRRSLFNTTDNINISV